jgi:type II restriction enzyme
VELELDFALAGNFKSASQAAKVVTESWVSQHLACISCGGGRLVQTPPNTPACDFVCNQARCAEPYELKARRGHLGRVVVDGAFGTLSTLWDSGEAANLLLLGYDRSAMTVRDLFAVHRSLLSRIALHRRPPLPPSARRAGWVGANILLDRLPQGALIPIVARGRVCDPRTIRAEWDRYRFLGGLKATDRGWLADILACLRRLPNRVFTLGDAYSFEEELSSLHPRNRNVRPKIRQQLQLLVAHGITQRITPGLYRLV